MKVSSRQRRKKVSVTVYITPEQNTKLRKLSARTDVPVAVYVRKGIDSVLRKAGL